MTVLAGLLIPSPVGGPDFIPTPDLSVRNTWTSSGNLAVGASSPLVGAITANAPIEMHPRSLSGVLATSFTREEYGRVVAVPSSIDIGVATSEAVESFEIWNVSSADAICSTVTTSGMAGIINDLSSMPFTIPALKSNIVKYTIGINGSVDINASETFAFNTNTLTLTITGQRSLVQFLWPLEGVEEKLSWLTDIITTWTGLEQRIKVRSNPRRNFKMSFWPTTKRLSQIMENMCQAWRSHSWSLPLFPEAMPLTSLPADGAYAVAVDTSNMTLAAGDLCMIWFSDDAHQELAVESLGSTSITFAKALSVPATASTGYAIPVQTARLSTQPDKERTPALTDKYTMEWVLLNESEVPGSIALDQYLGLDVFVYPSRFMDSSSQKVEYTKVTSEIDYKSGVVYFDSSVDFTSQQLQVNLVPTDKTTAFQLRQFFLNREGRLVPFWYPLYDLNMTLVNNIGSSDTTLVIEDCQFSLLSDHATRNHLFVETVSGDRYYRQIMSIAKGDAGEILTMDTALGANISTAQIKTLCFLGKFRLDEDTVTMTWSSCPPMKASTMILDVAQ